MPVSSSRMGNNKSQKPGIPKQPKKKTSLKVRLVTKPYSKKGR